MIKTGWIFVILLIVILIPSNAFGRSGFTPGYIIDLQHDTVRGLILNENWFSNPDVIAFKISKYRTVSYYKPTEILGFGFTDYEYVGAIVQKEISPFWDSELQKDPILHLVNDTVFLQTLIGGEKPLLYFKDTNEKEHFYIKVDSTYSLLLHKIYIAYEPNRKEFHNMRFLGQLLRYFWDDPTMPELITNTIYTKTNLEKLFNTYLNHQNIKNVFQHKDARVLSKFGVVAGISTTMVNVETKYFKAGFGPSTNLTGGVSFEMAMTGKLKDWSFYNELMYSSYTSANIFHYDFLASPVTFDFQYVRLNSLIRFCPSWFFINAGMSNGYVLKGESSAFAEIRKYEIGILAGAGVQYKNYSLEFRGEIGDGVSPYVNIISETHRFVALLSYSF